MQNSISLTPIRYKILERELRHDILEISRAYDSDEDKLFNFLIKKSSDPRVIFNKMEDLMKKYSDRALFSIRKISDCEAKNSLENLVMFTRTTV